jgi:D-tyrosyl-tRNA(Tyr) deacylase
MRLVVQRVREASVTVNGGTVAAIGDGMLVLVGFGEGDDAPEAAASIDAALGKMLSLRIFADEMGHMNRALADTGGGVMLVSQFTLYADCRKGRRPSFHLACPPKEAEVLFNSFCTRVRERYSGPVETGIFAANMQVNLVNDGPVTILLDSADF